jgi:hypothetical protein
MDGEIQLDFADALAPPACDFTDISELMPDLLAGIAATEACPETLQHPLFHVLLRLVREIYTTLAGGDIDPKWTLEWEIRTALTNPDVHECVFVEDGRIRFHPDPIRDDFMFSTLGLYEAVLLGLAARRAMIDHVAVAQGAIENISLPSVPPAPKRGREETPDVPPVKISRRLPEHADKLLKKWLLSHTAHPFPNDDEKDELALRSGLTHRQINNYLINARRRFLKTIRSGD